MKARKKPVEAGEGHSPVRSGKPVRIAPGLTQRVFQWEGGAGAEIPYCIRVRAADKEGAWKAIREILPWIQAGSKEGFLIHLPPDVRMVSHWIRVDTTNIKLKDIKEVFNDR